MDNVMGDRSSFGNLPRVALVLLLAAALGAMAWRWYGGSATAPEEGGNRGRNAAVAVETALVQRATLHDLRQFSGTLEAPARFDVAPRIAGRLDRLYFGIGDSVKRNEVVARLDDDEQRQQVDQARAELGVASASLMEAGSLLVVRQRQYERVKLLYTKKIASLSELEGAQSEAEAQQARLQVAEAQVKQREAALRAAEVRLSFTVIRASWNEGSDLRVVGQRYVNEGQTLSANMPILSLLETSTLIAVSYAAERDYPRLRPGMPANVYADGYPERAFRGRIARLAPVFQEASRQARVELEVDNPEGLLKPGMFARLEVEVAKAVQATAVPIEALVTRGGITGVFLADPEGRQARFLPVRTGIVQPPLAEIVTPPLSGRVVTLGNHLLSDGRAIVVVDGEASAPAAANGNGRPQRGGRSAP
jgi:RND family efflux transporter MFP subunit